MWPSVVVVAYEAPVLLEQVRLSLVRFMERFYLADGCGSAHARGDMLNPQFPAVLIKLGYSTSSRLKLCSLIREYLFRNTIPLNRFLKQQQSVFSRWAPNLNRTSYEA